MGGRARAGAAVAPGWPVAAWVGVSLPTVTRVDFRRLGTWCRDRKVRGRMFTGIVEELGVVTAIEPRRDAASLTIECDNVLEDVSHGASIAVNGVCLTVTSFTRSAPPGGPPGGGFTADVMLETLRRSSLGDLGVGDRVNLERPVRLSDRLGGHLVQGHVDGVGTVLERIPAEHWEIVRIALPPGLDRYLVEKGSVTVDGVSLTVVDVAAATATGPASFSVSLIPTTLAVTTLGTRAAGDKVNLEVDVVAKYVEKLHLGAGAGAAAAGPVGSAAPGVPGTPAVPVTSTGSSTAGIVVGATADLNGSY